MCLQKTLKNHCLKGKDVSDADNVKAPAKRLKNEKGLFPKKKNKKTKKLIKSTDEELDTAIEDLYPPTESNISDSASPSKNIAATQSYRTSTKIINEAWSCMGVPTVIIKTLVEQNFHSPTIIQARTLPAAILGRRDILGAAETGSGKTLAFGIPIIKGILELKSQQIETAKCKKTVENDSDEEIEGNTIFL